MRNPRIETLFFGLTHNRGFQELASRVASRERGGVLRLSGLTLTARAVYTALLYRETSRPLIVVTDGNKQAEALYPLLARTERPVNRTSSTSTMRLPATSNGSLVVATFARKPLLP